MCPYRRRGEGISGRDFIDEDQNQGNAKPAYYISRPLTDGVNNSYYRSHHSLDPRFEATLEAGGKPVSLLYQS